MIDSKLYDEVSRFLNIFNFNIGNDNINNMYIIENENCDIVGTVKCLSYNGAEGRIYDDNFYMDFKAIKYEDNYKPFTCIINYCVNNNKYGINGKNVIKSDYKTGKRIATSCAKLLDNKTSISFSSIYNEFSSFLGKEKINFREESLNHYKNGKMFKIKQKDGLVIYHNISHILEENIDGVFYSSSVEDLPSELESLLSEYDEDFYLLMENIKDKFDNVSPNFCTNLYKYSLSDSYKEKLGWLLDKSFNGKDSKVKILK